MKENINLGGVEKYVLLKVRVFFVNQEAIFVLNNDLRYFID